ncbi:hypothetical protein M422DRAFT_258071 [Sphaerobolus stellatus SS14]|uniref:Uncharacterized protein n=1 Tax=Sphaerobolus stellatus (strain SS14) TaxID=990650 RepID=A0A0C9VMK2_SPHS4|nr:hypothetical protein M422DRAFT_258071 [Sphaerobolus stellatus SS14]
MKKLSSPSSSFAHQHHQLSSPMTSSHPNPSHPSSHSIPEAGTLEAATKAENDVHAFLADLPEGWKLDRIRIYTHILDEQRLLKLLRAPNVDAKPRPRPPTPNPATRIPPLYLEPPYPQVILAFHTASYGI